MKLKIYANHCQACGIHVNPDNPDTKENKLYACGIYGLCAKCKNDMDRDGFIRLTDLVDSPTLFLECDGTVVKIKNPIYEEEEGS